MRGTLHRAVSAVLLAAVAAGCGNDKKAGPRGGEDLAKKQIKAAEKSAARSCLAIHARDRRLAAEKIRDKIRGPLDAAEAGLKAARERYTTDRSVEAKTELDEAQKEFNRLNTKLSPQLGPAEKEVSGWSALLKDLEGARGRKLCELAGHDVKEQNPKTPDERQSVMRLTPLAHKNVLGQGELKFMLTWRKMARNNPYTKARVNWELRKVKLLSEEED